MNEISLIGEFLPLGVGGVLAIVVIIFYRQDRKDSEDKRVAQEERMVKAAESYAKELERLNARYERLAESLVTLVESQVRQNAALEQTIKQQGQIRELELMESRLKRQYGKGND